ncbi:hypothetical protein QAD02_000103 [Eretmocerus hayati]|uniref:Uncharacterized protein n=1 Tax=Eretmocerus hayati TaxID=131215 RepID=A0ACC2NCG5_9HYME|nr:hypothetical protein QAD02_000103 [Eretmocerus hayati]
MEEDHDHEEVEKDRNVKESRIQANFFYNKSINHLVTIKNAFKWSDDNRLSIVSNNGVFVFDFVPSPMQANPVLNLLQTHINCPESTPGEMYAETIETKIFDWDSRDIRSFLMKPNFTPNFQYTLKASSNIVDVFWSPQDLLCPSRCLLAILTSHGVVELTVSIKHYWISIYDFSSEWIKTVNSDFQAIDSDNLDCKMISTQLERLQATSVAWSPLKTNCDDTPFAYLAIGHRNSEIVVWKIHQVTSDSISADSRLNVEMKFKKKVLPENLKINTMGWIHVDEGQYLLLIGFFDGQLGCLKLQEFEGGITCCPFIISHDADLSPVHDVQLLQQRSNNIEIIVTKEKHLCFLMLNGTGQTMHKEFTLIPGFSITGVSLLDFSTVLVATQDGNLCLVKKITDEGEWTCKSIKNCSIRNDVQYLGVASSKNKILHAVMTSPRYLYDHLVDREPSCINFFYLENSSIENPLTILFREKNLSEYWDCLELVKINALKYNQQPKLPLGMEPDFESMPLQKLKVIYWIMIINETYRKKCFPLEQSDLIEDIELCRHNIFLRFALHYLKILIHKNQLSDLQKLCMHLLVRQFNSYLSPKEKSNNSAIVESMREVMREASKLNLPTEEKCNLCNEVITELNALSCPTGHLISRCAITCLQVTCTRFRSCMTCQEIFHPSLDAELKKVRCLYCDLPAQYKSRNIDPAVLNSKKNLSKKVHIAGSKDLKDDCGD